MVSRQAPFLLSWARNGHRWIGRWHTAWRCALGLAVPALVALLGRVGEPLLGPAAAWLVSFGVVLLVTWMAGVGPGLLAALSSTLFGGWLLLPPAALSGSAAGRDWGAILGYLVFSTTFVLISPGWTRAASSSAGSGSGAGGRMRPLLDHVADGVIVFDAHGAVLALNPAAETLTGWSADEAAGQPLGEVFRPVAEERGDALRLPLPDPAAGTPQTSTASLQSRAGPAAHRIEYLVAWTDRPDGQREGAVVFRGAADGERSERELRELLHRETLARRQAETAQACMAFLAEASEVLASSLDYEKTLETVARLTVPTLADWCMVELVERGACKRVAVHHRDPGKLRLIDELRRRYPPNLDAQQGVGGVIRTARPLLVPEVTDEVLEQAARDPDQLRTLRTLGIQTAMVVPLIARNQTLGAMLLASDRPGHRYGDEDLRTAEDLAGRCAQAIDSARLLQQAEEAIAIRDRAIQDHRRVEDQLASLAEASGKLTSSLEPSDVRSSVLRLAEQLLAADAYAIWRCDESSHWQIVAAAGLSAAFQAAALCTMESTQPMPQQPIVAPDVFEPPILAKRRQSYEMEGIRSLIAVPLRIHGQTCGSLTVYYKAPHTFHESDVRLATALANLAGSALASADMFAEQARLRFEAQQQRESLRELDRRKDEFLAMMAHELRNPLAPIRTGLELLVQKHGADEILVLMQEQVDHLVRLLDDLLDVSRMMRGKVQLRRQPVDLLAEVQRAVAAVRARIDSQEHELFLLFPPEPIWIEADPVRLGQIVSNLLNNAVQYTPRGGRIWLSLGRQEEQAVLSVRDSGIGIDAEFLPRAFDLFAQADRSLERTQGGLGIGLTLVRNLAELHGGTVAARSAGYGKGSEFVVRLPLLPSHPHTAPRIRDAPAVPSLRILVVDDNVVAARMQSMLLTRLGGHHVRTAHDGPTALLEAARFRPEIVLLDIGLPGMNGYEVARRLRQDADLAGIVLVALTGYGSEEDRRQALAAGCDAHLVKPPSIEALQEVLALTLRPSADNSIAPAGPP